MLKSVEDRHLHGDVLQAANCLARARGGVLRLSSTRRRCRTASTVRPSVSVTISLRRRVAYQPKVKRRQMSANQRRSSLPAFVLESFAAMRQSKAPEEEPQSLAERTQARRACRETRAIAASPVATPRMSEASESERRTRRAPALLDSQKCPHVTRSVSAERVSEASSRASTASQCTSQRGRRTFAQSRAAAGDRKKKERRKRAVDVRDGEGVGGNERATAPGLLGDERGPGRETFARSKSQNVSFLELLRGLKAAGEAERASSTAQSRRRSRTRAYKRLPRRPSCRPTRSHQSRRQHSALAPRPVGLGAARRSGPRKCAPRALGKDRAPALVCRAIRLT